MRNLIRQILRENFIDTDEFIRRSRNVHGDFYDYKDSVFTKSTEPIQINCPIHGPFNQIANVHYNGSGCPKCGSVSTAQKRTQDTNSFIQKAKKIYNDKYDYSKTNYEKAINLVKIVCPLHGEFQVTPHKHLGGQGCPKCSEISKRKKRMTTQDSFIQKSKEIHGDLYDYSQSIYNGLSNKVDVICPIHGSFKILPGNHYKGQGCPICGDQKQGQNTRDNTSIFIQKAKQQHGDTYDYSLVDYTKSNIAVDIICKKHGVFSMRPNNHLNHEGCPICNESRGERMVSKILNDFNIPFKRQHKFTDCFSIGKKRCYKLPFDFYLPDYNSCIEFDGKQHFTPVKLYGGDEGFKKRQNLDNIKNEYCIKNNINLIRIPYTVKHSEIYKIIKDRLGLV
jgi:hypothetical protein